MPFSYHLSLLWLSSLILGFVLVVLLAVTSSLSLGSAFVLDMITLVLVVLPEVSSSLSLLSSALETTLALVEVAVVEESSLTVFITLVRVLALMV